MDLRSKLQIKPGQTVAVLNSPPGPALRLDSDAPQHARKPHRVPEADAVIGFVVRRDDLSEVEPVLAAARADRLAWIGYPKGGRLGTDLNRDLLVDAVTEHGVQPVRQVSIDDTWSALRLRPLAAGR
jgi:hypothetical protein